MLCWRPPQCSSLATGQQGTSLMLAAFPGSVLGELYGGHDVQQEAVRHDFVEACGN